MIVTPNGGQKRGVRGVIILRKHLIKVLGYDDQGQKKRKLDQSFPVITDPELHPFVSAVALGLGVFLVLLVLNIASDGSADIHPCDLLALQLLGLVHNTFSWLVGVLDLEFTSGGLASLGSDLSFHPSPVVVEDGERLRGDERVVNDLKDVFQAKLALLDSPGISVSSLQLFLSKLISASPHAVDVVLVDSDVEVALKSVFLADLEAGLKGIEWWDLAIGFLGVSGNTFSLLVRPSASASGVSLEQALLLPLRELVAEFSGDRHECWWGSDGGSWEVGLWR